MFLSHSAKYLCVFAAAFTLAYVLTPLVGGAARLLGMIDMPDARRINTRPTPRGGGIAIFIAFHLVCAVLFLFSGDYKGSLSIDWWWRFLVVSSLVAAVGLEDDLGIIGMPMKLAWQIAAACLAFKLDMRVGVLTGLALPWAVDLAVTIVWYVGIMNAFNLIDGLDGLATGLASIAAVGLAGSFVLQQHPGDTLVVLALLGACLAFLRYNFHPARIYLGDTGSLFIGCALASIALHTGTKGALTASFLFPLVVVGVPVFDTMLAIWRRSVRGLLDGGAPWKGLARIVRPDVEHLHHRMIRMGLTQRKVAGGLYLAAASLVAMGLLSLAFRSRALGIYLITFLVVVYVVVRHLARTELWDSSRAIVRGLKRPPRKVISVIMYPICDLAIMGIVHLIALALVYQGSPRAPLRMMWLKEAPLWVGVPFIAMFMVRSYVRVWSRARVSEYVVTTMAFMAGVVVATALSNIVWAIDFAPLMRQATIYGGIAAIAVIGLRTLPRAVQDAIPLVRRFFEPCPVTTLVVSAGHSFLLFLRARCYEMVDMRHFRTIVGVVDDDTNLHGRYVHGYQVLGGTARTAEFIMRYGVKEIVIAGDLEEGVRRSIVRAAVLQGVRVMEWRTALVPLNTASKVDWHDMVEPSALRNDATVHGEATASVDVSRLQ